jgi:predicted NUDIX family phosphoesterase
MTERVLVIPARLLDEAGRFHGFTDRVGDYLPRLLDPSHLRYLPRDEAEVDPAFKQLIPYLVVRHAGRLFHYQRRGGGEKRLHARRSIGLGGHICSDDGAASADAYQAGMRRELLEEVSIAGTFSERCVGLINDDRTPVGRVHLGVVHLLDVSSAEVTCREPTLESRGFDTPQELRRAVGEFESWSQFLLEGAAL